METKKKRVYKLKTWPKVLFVLIIIGCIAFYYFNKYYQEYLYEQTNEYKLLQEGYSADDVSAMLAKLSDEQEKDILNRDYNEFIPRFIECKYFMYKNLDDYLNQVITKDEDFFSAPPSPCRDRHCPTLSCGLRGFRIRCRCWS